MVRNSWSGIFGSPDIAYQQEVHREARSTQESKKYTNSTQNRHVRKAVAKLVAEVHKGYPKSRCTEGSGQTVYRSTQWYFVFSQRTLHTKSTLDEPVCLLKMVIRCALQLPASHVSRARGAHVARSSCLPRGLRALGEIQG